MSEHEVVDDRYGIKDLEYAVRKLQEAIERAESIESPRSILKTKLAAHDNPMIATLERHNLVEGGTELPDFRTLQRFFYERQLLENDHEAQRKESEKEFRSRRDLIRRDAFEEFGRVQASRHPMTPEDRQAYCRDLVLAAYSGEHVPAVDHSLPGRDCVNGVGPLDAASRKRTQNGDEQPRAELRKRRRVAAHIPEITRTIEFRNLESGKCTIMQYPRDKGHFYVFHCERHGIDFDTENPLRAAQSHGKHTDHGGHRLDATTALQDIATRVEGCTSRLAQRHNKAVLERGTASQAKAAIAKRRRNPARSRDRRAHRSQQPDPIPGEIYSSYFEPAAKYFGVLALPFENRLLRSVGVPGTFESLGLLAKIPNCCSYDRDEQRLKWAAEYEDDGLLKDQRSFPIVWFRDEGFRWGGEAGWLKATDLTFLAQNADEAEKLPFYDRIQEYWSNRSQYKLVADDDTLEFPGPFQPASPPTPTPSPTPAPSPPSRNREPAGVQNGLRFTARRFEPARPSAWKNRHCSSATNTMYNATPPENGKSPSKEINNENALAENTSNHASGQIDRQQPPDHGRDGQAGRNAQNQNQGQSEGGDHGQQTAPGDVGVGDEIIYVQEGACSTPATTVPPVCSSDVSLANDHNDDRGAQGEQETCPIDIAQSAVNESGTATRTLTPMANAEGAFSRPRSVNSAPVAHMEAFMPPHHGGGGGGGGDGSPLNGSADLQHRPGVFPTTFVVCRKVSHGRGPASGTSCGKYLEDKW